MTRTEHKEPLVRLVKRTAMPAGKAWAIRGASVVLALLIGALLILVLGHNPAAVYKDIVTGSLSTATARTATM